MGKKPFFLDISARFRPKLTRFELERPQVSWTPSTMGSWAPRLAKLALQGPKMAVFWPYQRGKKRFWGVFGPVIAHLTLGWFGNLANGPYTFKYGCNDP